METTTILTVLTCIGFLVAPAAAQYGSDTPQEQQESEQPDQQPEDQENESDGEQENEVEEDETGDEQENETEEEDEPEETDEPDISTAVTISESDARIIARQSLSENNWMLEESSVEEDEGYYRFRYVVQGTESEAEVRVDGSSGEVLRRTEEPEPGISQIEQAQTPQVTSLQQARDRIKDLRETITELRRENARLRSTDSRGPPESTEQTSREREVEAKTELNGSEIEVEAERSENRTEAEVEVEDRQGPPETEQTPGDDTARQNRPGFVNEVLSAIFG